MISAADKKLLAAAIADSQASVFVIDARDTPAEQAKYIQLHKASMKPTLDKNHSIFFIHSPVSALKHKRWFCELASGRFTGAIFQPVCYDIPAMF